MSVHKKTELYLRYFFRIHLNVARTEVQGHSSMHRATATWKTDFQSKDQFARRHKEIAAPGHKLIGVVPGCFWKNK